MIESCHKINFDFFPPCRLLAAISTLSTITCIKYITKQTRKRNWEKKTRRNGESEGKKGGTDISVLRFWVVLPLFSPFPSSFEQGSNITPDLRELQTEDALDCSEAVGGRVNESANNRLDAVLTFTWFRVNMIIMRGSGLSLVFELLTSSRPI